MACVTSLGFVVLARRPNPNGGHTVEPVSAVFNGPKALEQAQNVQESCDVRDAMACKAKSPEECLCADYIIGQIIDPT